MVSYEEFQRRSSFTQAEIIAFAGGTLIDDQPEGFASRLPLPPLLLLDRLIEISRQGNRGRIVAEQEVRKDDWFFGCHFKDDPVQPGCLSIDAIWQMIGFFCTWSGGVGSGRALGCKEVVFEGQILPTDTMVRYEVDIRRFSILERSGAVIAVGNGDVLVDGHLVCSVKDAKVGVFRDLTQINQRRAGGSSGGASTKRE
ncbi:MAG: 3-hydroxyacyl-[acyl-carrier-protein] dehydratase FabA [Deltaproteobacteria bacterium RBG_13_65_10]|jgi:3-hydroxyacyl-[acyl-carrier protein] dehydratase/trans-2-decenoyl-[acyl-carrier protein] isomerase|nr:MAG: 3-hydroxyacyl-[acyl-carrier-protein] dehydratase FabA [Deltaproteobacteria bacterium RBG_13_65_10]